MESEDTLIARLGEIEAAVVDLRPFVFGVHKASEVKPGASAARRYRNRLQHALLLLNHLQADANRLARRKGLAKDVVTSFVERSQCVRVCNRAANTHKHGLGGRARNATLPSSFITMVKDPQNVENPDTADALIIGMLISDADEGSFTSQALLECAAREWARFLQARFGIDCSDWLTRCFPPPRGPVVPLRPEGNNVIPQRSAIRVEVPQHLSDAMTDAVRKRRDES